MDDNLPYWLQWVGLLATLGGAGVSLASLIWAIRAARSAKTASEEATLAKQAATRLGRVAQVGDLINDMQELQAMIARSDFPAIAAKASHLRGRVVRFKGESYTDLSEEEQQGLDSARDQLEIIGRESAVGKAS